MAKDSISEELVELTVSQKVWRWFRSMRTALSLVLLLAIASIIGTLIPQAGQNEQGILGFTKQYPSVAKLFELIGFFDVYGSWWFYLLNAALFTSLIACIIPRTQSFFSKVKSKPKTPATERFVSNLHNKAGFSISLSNSIALDTSASVLKKKRYRIHRFSDRPNEIYAEKGRFGDLGSLIFHYMFILLLVGVAYGKTTGFDNYAVVIEGDSFTENSSSYADVSEGPWFGGKHTNFKFTLDDFMVTYQPNGQPKDYVSKVRVFDENGKFVLKKKVEVNDKLVYKGVKVYQSSYGWAPRIAILKDGKEIYNQASALQGRATSAGGQIQTPDGTFTAEVTFIPDLQEQSGQFAAGSFYLNNPALYVTANSYESGQQKQIFDGVVKFKENKDIGSGYTLKFPEIKEWSGFQVVKDAGVPIIYTAFGLATLGLYMTFYLSRKRVWVLVVPGEKGKTQLLLGGIAEKSKGAFEFEFSNLAEQVKIGLSKKGA